MYSARASIYFIIALLACPPALYRNSKFKDTCKFSAARARLRGRVLRLACMLFFLLHDFGQLFLNKCPCLFDGGFQMRIDLCRAFAVDKKRNDADPQLGVEGHVEQYLVENYFNQSAQDKQWLR
uniref:Uncharacterized protein n=1 Tax=Lotharella oceanica TaxID=641309 RepID=A0A7S2TKJ4_9EUKA